MHIAYLDEKGNVRPAKTWGEVKESICNNWDSCEPCSYAGGYSLTHGGRECLHPLCPHNENKRGNKMPNVELRIDGAIVDLTSCPSNKDHMSCYLTGEEADQRAKCAYCWLTKELESYHIDAPIGRLQRKS